MLCFLPFCLFYIACSFLPSFSSLITLYLHTPSLISPLSFTCSPLLHMLPSPVSHLSSLSLSSLSLSLSLIQLAGSIDEAGEAERLETLEIPGQSLQVYSSQQNLFMNIIQILCTHVYTDNMIQVLYTHVQIMFPPHHTHVRARVEILCLPTTDHGTCILTHSFSPSSSCHRGHVCRVDEC